MAIYSNYNKNAPSIGQSGLLHGQIKVNPNDYHSSRIAKFLYSKDIISLTCFNHSIPTYYGNDVAKILMVPADQLGTQNVLTKLRFVYDNENPHQRLLSPLVYQRDLFIEFNSINEQPPKRFAHDPKLGLYVASENNDDIFQIFNASNNNDHGPIQIGDKIIIGCSLKTSSDNAYLVVNSNDYSIKINGSLSEATKFTIASSIGCGPNWLYDQDTRELGGQSFSQSEVQDLSVEQEAQLSSQLQGQKSDLTSSSQQLQQQTDGTITKEQRTNDDLRKQLDQLTTQYPQPPPPLPTIASPCTTGTWKPYLVYGQYQWGQVMTDSGGQSIMLAKNPTSTDTNIYSLNKSGQQLDSNNKPIENSINLCPANTYGSSCQYKICPGGQSTCGYQLNQADQMCKKTNSSSTCNPSTGLCN